MFRRMLFGVLLVCALGGPARAAPYWIAYEGDDFPENGGWERRVGGVGADRSLSNGVFVIDSLANHEVFDSYRIDRQIDADPGELFIAEWRVRILENLNLYDAGLGIAPDGGGTLAFKYKIDRLISTREEWEIPIEPGVFHSYRIESTDMENYSLWIDGVFARLGVWDLNSLNRSFVAFGDMQQFGATGSVSEWDYFRFGVVPEPSTGGSVLVGALSLFFLGNLRLRKVANHA